MIWYRRLEEETRRARHRQSVPSLSERVHSRLRHSRLELGLMDFEYVPNPPYCPDLAPLDFPVFPEIKAQLWGQRFGRVGELTVQTQLIYSQFNEEWYRHIFNTCVQRH